MITLKLNENTAEDWKCVEELRSLGIPDEVIQRLYDESLAREEKGSQ